MRQIFLDTETTGLSAATGDRVIEIGCVELLNRKLTGNNKHFYLNPERDSHEDALKVHGISNEFLRDKPKFEAVADELLPQAAVARASAPPSAARPARHRRGQGAGVRRPGERRGAGRGRGDTARLSGLCQAVRARRITIVGIAGALPRDGRAYLGSARQ